MIEEILTAAGVLFARGRFLRMPEGTHAVYFDDIDALGGDGALSPKIYHHSITVEMYEPKPDPDAESALEAEFDAWGLDWEKQDRLWINDLQRYQTVYELSYTSKIK